MLLTFAYPFVLVRLLLVVSPLVHAVLRSAY